MFEKTDSLEPRIHLLFETDSTQNLAKNFLKTYSLGANEKFHCEGFVALHQSQGRGRQGRAWIEDSHTKPFDQIFYSLALSLNKTTTPSFRKELLPLAYGYCVYEFLFITEKCLVSYQNGKVFLKWPNDLVFEETSSEHPYKKFGGILVEGLGGNFQFALGLGLNFRKSPQGLKHQSCALFDFTKNKSLHALGLIAGIQNHFSQFLNSWIDSPEIIQKELLEKLWNQAMVPLHKKTVEVNLGTDPLSSKAIQGEIRGLSVDGALQVWIPSQNRLQNFYAGEISIR